MYSHCIRRQNNLPKLERLCVLRKGLGTVAERKLNMKTNTRKIAGVGLLTAVVVVLQLLGSFIHFGPFSISLVLIPIVVGASLYGVLSGAWLGLAFGITVLISGNAAAFLAVNPGGTVITVLLKGALAGLWQVQYTKQLKRKTRLLQQSLPQSFAL